jgi:hypothetical protein
MGTIKQPAVVPDRTLTINGGNQLEQLLILVEPTLRKLRRGTTSLKVSDTHLQSLIFLGGHRNYVP